ncbi:EAL domain-containing protein [Marinospirillum sp. MEB164]|uniref:EAL domain-containing protein n=1 Tax=Marinospirillum alkalitolerans TaxID=3123374 RepID=A0ABW8PYX3_9GAMM
MPLNQQADILIVDDHAVNCELLMSLLEDEGFTEVEALLDPRLVMPRLQQRRPDLIFLDIRMPHLSGLELLSQMQAQWPETLPPVIVLTANTDQETRHQALALGARDFLTKPFDHQEVVQRLSNILQEHLRLQQQRVRADQLEALVAERTQELARQAVTDSLTGLPNRDGLLQRLGERLQRGEDQLVLFFVFHGIKEMTRLHGLEVADHLTQALRDQALAHQQEGDQWGVWSQGEWVLLRPCPAVEQLESEALEQQIQPLIHQLRQPLYFRQFRLAVQVRVGASATCGPRNAETLIRLAALAVPKEFNRWQEYSPALEASLQRQLSLQEALDQAISQQQLSLVFQPKIWVPELACRGAEALLRWEHPELGRISPADFIPLAEQTGQIMALGRWVQEAACRQLQAWRDQLPADFVLAVNVASQQLADPDFAQQWLATLADYQLPPTALEIEVTESGLMQDMDEALKQLSQLAEAGVSIAIDDFGTGYSSLAYLKNLPVSVLKIDRAFIQDMHVDPQAAQLVDTIIQLAASMGFITVAEGVEEEAQLHQLMAQGCPIIQGYYFSPPVPARVFLAQLNNTDWPPCP